MVAPRARDESLSTTRRRCGSCQKRHIKCEYENNDEKCKACRTGDRTCIVRHRFHHVDPTAPKRAKTGHTGEAQTIQDGFQIIQEFGHRKPASTDDSTVTSEDNTSEEQTGTSSIKPAPTSVDTIQDLIHKPSPVQSVHSPSSIRLQDPATYNFPDHFSPSDFARSELNFQSPTSIPTPEASRLQDQEKAILLRHFTDVLSRWFDVCDADQHFRRVVPQRALTCPTLLKAISASSAWHLTRLGRFDKERSNFLYQNCLNHLIRQMDSPAVGSDDSVLVAAVIMHHVEELRDLEHTLNLETRGHLIGIQVFTENQDPMSTPSSLRTAALRTAIREEIHVSFVDQQPLTLPAEVCNVDRSFGVADDDTWAWRIMLLYRDALAYSLAPSAISDWDMLWESHQTWVEQRPASFDPTFVLPTSPSDGRYLPEAWYLLDCHTIGAIHFQLCRLVLAVSNPRTPKIGWNKTAAARRVEEEIKNCVVEICGIAKSNHLFPSAMTAGSMVVTMLADNITDPNIQAACLDILVQTRTVHAWPTEAAQRYVKSVWQAQQEQSPASPLSSRSIFSSTE